MSELQKTQTELLNMSLQKTSCKLQLTFAGGSVSRRLGETVDRLQVFSVNNKAISGGGLLESNKDVMRRSKLINLNQLVNERNLVIQVGGNDFFVHTKNGKHITSFQTFNDKYSQDQFADAIQDFLRKFSGGSVWFVLLFPRYLKKCCDKHVDEIGLQKANDLVNDVNTMIKKQVDYFNREMGKSIFFLDLQLLHGLENQEALSIDNIHLKDSANDICAKEIISYIVTNTGHDLKN